MKQLTALEIIDETVAFYSEDPSRRAFKNGNCIYQATNGNKCAIGRCMNEAGLQQFGNSNDSVDSLGLDEPLDTFLQEQYHGQNSNFWGELQTFHDMPRNWNSSGITTQGIQEAQNLKTTFIHLTGAHVEN